MVYWTAVYISPQATEKLLIVCKAQKDFMYILSTYLHTTKYWLLRLQKCYVLHIETCGLSWQIIDEFNNLFQIQGSCPRLLMNQSFLKKVYQFAKHPVVIMVGVTSEHIPIFGKSVLSKQCDATVQIKTALCWKTTLKFSNCFIKLARNHAVSIQAAA